MEPHRIDCGLDVGKDTDPSALAIVSVSWTDPPPRQPTVSSADASYASGPDGRYRLIQPEASSRTPQRSRTRPSPPLFTCQFLETLPLGMPYLEQARRVSAVIGQVQHDQRFVPITVYYDATRDPSYVDVLRQAGVRCKIVGVSFTGGNIGPHPNDHGGQNVSVAHMVSRLNMLLETGRLLLPSTETKRQVQRELSGFRGKLSRALNVLFGSEPNVHDDRVFALGLATLADGVQPPSPEAARTLRNARFWPT